MAFKHTKKLWQSTAIAGAMALSPFMVPSDSLANPLGGVVANGSAVINTSGPVTTINQHSNQAVIDWASFNIGAGETTQFIQPSSQSIAVNRIHDVNPSVINGALTANGQIVLINQNGMVFGSGAQVDVGSLVVSTADIGDVSDLSSRILDFDMAGSSDASIINNGHITVAESGLAAFVAPHIVNNGIIQASLGSVQLGAGDVATVDLYGDGLINLAITDETINKSITNSGTINAQGGDILLTAKAAKGIVESVINMDGVLNASSVSQEGGRIVLSGSDITVSGTITADGATGGGEILIGGDYQGQGTIETATTTTVTQNTLITANATDSGDGGTVIVWADDTTFYNGDIEAIGAGTGSDGFVETSGKDTLTVGSQASVVADEWLLDPTNVTIQNGSGDNVGAGGSFDPASGTVDADTIQAALNSGTSVTITTAAAGADDGDITLSSATINKTTGGDATLTLRADNSIISSSSSITSTSGALNVTLHSDSDNSGAGAINLLNTTITTNGGDFIAGGGLNPLTDFAMGTTANRTGVLIGGSTDINTGAGNINIRGQGEMGTTVDAEYGVYLFGAPTLETTTGYITITGTGGDGGANNHGIRFFNPAVSVTTETGAITLTGTGGVGAGTNNRGLDLLSGSISSTGLVPTAGAITLTGTGGASSTGGARGINSEINVTSAYGDIIMTGQGTDSTGTGNVGLFLSGGLVSSTGTGVGAANITLDGTGGNGTSDNTGIRVNNATVSSIDGNIALDGTGGDGTRTNIGVYVSGGAGSITTVNGDIDITAQGGNGTGASNEGFNVSNSSSIRSTGTGGNAGGITINAMGGAGNVRNRGASINSGGQISSVDGDIFISATGGNATSINTHGFSINGAGSSIDTVMGNIDIFGQGNGNGNSSVSHGIIITDSASINSTGIGASVGDITLSGIGTASTSSYGITLDDSSINSVDGNIDITGQGGNGGGDDNYGVFIASSGAINSTGTGTNAGTITVNGTGGDGGATNRGVYIDAGQINTVDGNINLTGQGGNSTGNSDSGVFIEGGAHVISTGTTVNAGDITIEGRGGDGSGNLNHGFAMTSNSIIETNAIGNESGHIFINGTAGNATGLASGVILTGSPQVRTIDGNINVTATGGNGTSSRNVGITMTNGGIFLTTGVGENAGNIDVRATAGNGTNDNVGILFEASGNRIRTTDGDINLVATGNGTGIRNHGFNISLADISTNGNGNVLLTGNVIGSGTGTGINISGATVDIGGSGAQSVTLIADSIDSTAQSIEAMGDVIIQTFTPDNSIGLGSGSGNLSLSNTELAQINAGGSIVIGSATGVGMTDIDGATVGSSLEVLGGDILVNTGGLTSTDAITLNSNGDIDITGDVTSNGDLLAFASGNFTAAGTVGTPITIDTTGNEGVFVSHNILDINQYVTVNTAVNDFRIYGVNEGQVTIDGIANGSAMSTLLPVRNGLYNIADTGYGLFYEPIQTTLPDSVVTPTPSITKPVIDPLVEVKKKSQDQKNSKSDVNKASVEESNQEQSRVQSCLVALSGAGCLIDQQKFSTITSGIVDKFNTITRIWKQGQT